MNTGHGPRDIWDDYDERTRCDRCDEICEISGNGCEERETAEGPKVLCGDCIAVLNDEANAEAIDADEARS